jgi:hypothetical protein
MGGVSAGLFGPLVGLAKFLVRSVFCVEYAVRSVATRAFAEGPK